MVSNSIYVNPYLEKRSRWDQMGWNRQLENLNETIGLSLCFPLSKLDPRTRLWKTSWTNLKPMRSCYLGRRLAFVKQCTGEMWGGTAGKAVTSGKRLDGKLIFCWGMLGVDLYSRYGSDMICLKQYLQTYPCCLNQSKKWCVLGGGRYPK